MYLSAIEMFLFYCIFCYLIISEDEEEDFSKGAENFVEAAKKRRTERQSDEGNNSIHYTCKIISYCLVTGSHLFRQFHFQHQI